MILSQLTRLNSSGGNTGPRMHVMESVCRDAMLRHNSADKIEEINSQDEEDEAAGDSDVVVAVETTKGTNSASPAPQLHPIRNANVLNRPTSQQQQLPKPSEKAVEESASVDQPKVAEIVVESVPTAKGSSDRESSSESSVKVHDKERITAVDTDEVDKVQVVVEEVKKNEINQKNEEPNVEKVESKDCDKPKSDVVVEANEKKKEKELPVTDEVMDLDSQDTETVAVTEELPKESERVAVTEEKPDEKEIVDHAAETEGSKGEKSCPPLMETEVVLPQSEGRKTNGTESVSNSNEESSKSSESSSDYILKRKLSETKSPEANVPSLTEKEDSTRQPSKSPSTEAPAADSDKAAPEPAAKRPRLSETATEHLQRELEENFGRHDKLLREYITRSSAESGDGIQKHVDQLVMEIEALNDMIRTKEMEWNNMIHLKKVKEELVLRLTRKKNVQDIEAAPLDRTLTVAQASLSLPDVSNASLFSGSSASSRAASQANKLIKNLQLSSSTLSGAAATSKTTQSILQNRANMTTEDLEKEKKNTAKLHRHSIQGSSPASASTPTGGPAAVNTGSASSIGSHHRNSVSPAQHVHSGRASAPAVGSGGRSKTPTSTPIHSDSDLEQRMAAFHRLASIHHAQQNQEMQQQLLMQQQQQQQQQYEAALAMQNQAVAAAAAAASGQLQGVGRQGAIKNVRSIIEDFRQQHPESVPRRGRRMKTVPTIATAAAAATNASLMHSSGSSSSGSSNSSSSSLLMMMAQAANNNQNHNLTSNSSSTAKSDAVVMDMGGGGGLAEGGEIGKGGEVQLRNVKSKGSLNVSSGGAAKTIAISEKVKERRREEQRRVKEPTTSSRQQRGSEWQAMLNSLSESGTTATSLGPVSRPSSAESSSHSTASASAINSLLTQHGLLPAISVTSLAGVGGVNSRAEAGAGGGGGSRGSMNVQQPHQAQVQQQQQQHQQQQSAHQHAVAAAAAAAQHQTMQQLLQGSGNNSLLHGILTKQHHNQQQQQNARIQQQQQQQQQQAQQQQQQGAQGANGGGSGFSPTLARLLTAPERISTVQNVANYQAQNQQQQQSHHPSQNPVMNLSKNLKSEITITPVVAQNSSSGREYNNMMMSMHDDDQDDSADRLVIDEGIHNNNAVGGGNLLGNNTASHGIVHGQEFHENEVPECQGCKRKEAQFVCAGCGNQWYCSRECQVTAWDEHSETCTG